MVSRFLVLLFFLTAAVSSKAVFLGLTDDFEDGTVMGWGGGSFPINVNTGGPAGTDDNFMELFQGAPNGGQHLATYNFQQWGGDYSGQGIVVLEADMKNLTVIPIEMRVVMFGIGFTRITSTNYVTVPNDANWHRIAFPIRASDFTVVLNAGDSIASILSNNQRLMLRYDPDGPSSNGTNPPDGVTSMDLSVDNITAAAYASCTPTVAPSYIRGSNLGGDLTSLQRSDDNRFVSRPGAVLVSTQAPLLIELKSQATLPSFSELRFRIESSCSATAVVQKVFLYDYTTPGYVEVDSRNLANTDAANEMSITTNPGRFVSGTGEMKAQISYKANGGVLVFPWQARIDQVVWKLVP